MSQWVESGDITQVVFFDAPPGLGTWVINGAKGQDVVAAFTTPTVTELSLADMPGVYSLLLDEQTTIDAGKATEILKLYISAAGWAGKSIEVTLFKDLPANVNQVAKGGQIEPGGTGNQNYGEP